MACQMPLKLGFPATRAGRAAATAPRAAARAPPRPAGWCAPAPRPGPAGGLAGACPAVGITVSETAAAIAIATIAPENGYRICQVSSPHGVKQEGLVDCRSKAPRRVVDM